MNMGEFENVEIDDLPRWWYMGADRAIHGAFTSSEMQKWVESGYFNDSLMIKTDRDAKFYTLYEYTLICNGSPFLSNVFSFNAAYHGGTESRSSSVSIPHPPLNVAMPPPQQLQHIFQAHSGAPGIQMPVYRIPNNGPLIPPPMTTQVILPPGLELYQGGVPQGSYYESTTGSNEMLLRENPSSSTISDSPDYEHTLEDPQTTVDKCIDTGDAPWNRVLKTIDAATDTTGFAPFQNNSIAIQTGPQFIRRNDVVKLLKELTGMHYQIR